MPQGVGYPARSSGPLAKAMPGQATIADQFNQQSKPFGWVGDMVNSIVQMIGGGGQTQQEKPQPGQEQQPKEGQPAGQPEQPSGTTGQPQAGGVDPLMIPQLVSLFQPNALSNLGLLPQQQGSFDWVLGLMQQQQAAQAQQRGAGGNDLVSLVRQISGGAGGPMVPDAGTPSPSKKSTGKG